MLLSLSRAASTLVSGNYRISARPNAVYLPASTSDPALLLLSRVPLATSATLPRPTY